MQDITIFNKSSSMHEIRNYFHNEKKPFIIRNVIKSKINLDFLIDKFKKERVSSLNPNSNKEILSVGSLMQKVKNGEKHRLRANTKLGNKICRFIDTFFIENIKSRKKYLFDSLLYLEKTSRQKTLFLSTKGCTFSKQVHIISGLILHLNGKKTWYVSKDRESFFSIKYKPLLNPNPLYVTDKNPNEEFSFSLNPGDMLDMPAYWFHYTTSHNTNISYSYFFTGSFQYYYTIPLPMFLYQAITNPVFSLVKAVRKEALKFFKNNDYS